MSTVQHDNFAIRSPEDLHVTARRNGLIVGIPVAEGVGAALLPGSSCYPSSTEEQHPCVASLSYIQRVSCKRILRDAAVGHISRQVIADPT